MPKFKIEPHCRLQEWVAEEKGYFRAESLDYEFKEFIRSSDGAHHVTTGNSGAFQSIEKGRESNVTCACHWTVNVAASRGHTKLFADAYSELFGKIIRSTEQRPSCPAVGFSELIGDPFGRRMRHSGRMRTIAVRSGPMAGAGTPTIIGRVVAAR